MVISSFYALSDKFVIFMIVCQCTFCKRQLPVFCRYLRVFLAFSRCMCYTFTRTEQKQQVPSAPSSDRAGRSKGKRVQIPHDLVTVIRESTVRVLWAPATEPSGLGRRQQALNFQSGNLPAVGTGASAPDHEELVVPKSPNHCKGSFCFAVPQAKRPFFRCSGPLSCALLFSAAMFQTGKEAHT